LTDDRATYVEARKNAKKVVAIAQESKRQEFAKDLESTEGKKNIFWIAKQMAKLRQDVVGATV
jgi:hypothetical protein